MWHNVVIARSKVVLMITSPCAQVNEDVAETFTEVNHSTLRGQRGSAPGQIRAKRMTNWIHHLTSNHHNNRTFLNLFPLWIFLTDFWSAANGWLDNSVKWQRYRLNIYLTQTIDIYYASLHAFRHGMRRQALRLSAVSQLVHFAREKQAESTVSAAHGVGNIRERPKKPVQRSRYHKELFSFSTFTSFIRNIA